MARLDDPCVDVNIPNTAVCGGKTQEDSGEIMMIQLCTVVATSLDTNARAKYMKAFEIRFVSMPSRVGCSCCIMAYFPAMEINGMEQHNRPIFC